MTERFIVVEETQGDTNSFTVYQVGKYDQDTDNYTIEREVDHEWRTNKEAVQNDVDRLNIELVKRWKEKYEARLLAYEQQKAEWQALRDAGLREGVWMRNPPVLDGASRFKPELPWNHYVVMEQDIKIG